MSLTVRQSGPGRGKRFRTALGAHPASCSVGTGVLFPGGEAAGAWS